MTIDELCNNLKEIEKIVLRQGPDARPGAYTRCVLSRRHGIPEKTECRWQWYRSYKHSNMYKPTEIMSDVSEADISFELKSYIQCTECKCVIEEIKYIPASGTQLEFNFNKE